MSFLSAVSNNPDMLEGQQLADRQAAGVEDMFFINGSGDVTAPMEKLDQVDMEDRVVRRVDPSKLPIEVSKEYYMDQGHWRYVPKTQTLPDGKSVQIWMRSDRQGREDDKFALIGGKLYQIEFEKNGQAYLTTQVKDLFQNPAFTKGQTPTQKLTLLQQVHRASGFVSWYQSGEYYRNEVAKGRRDTAAVEDKLKPRSLELDADLEKLAGELTGQGNGITPPPNAKVKRSPSVAAIHVMPRGIGHYFGFSI